MNLKIIIRILILIVAALLIVGLVLPLEKTSWAEAKRSEGGHAQHERSDHQEETVKAPLEESNQTGNRKRKRRSENEISIRRIMMPLAKETVLMGIPFVLTLGVMKIWRWKSNSTR